MSYTQCLIDDDLSTKERTPRQRYASWATSNAGLQARAFMYRRQLGICLCCAKPAPLGQCEIDHYIPIKDGCDPLDESNMFIICKPCNRKKGPRKGAYKITVT
jgi:5-methylcytosine-specific restriction endonuclease McrA